MKNTGVSASFWDLDHFYNFYLGSCYFPSHSREKNKPPKSGKIWKISTTQIKSPPLLSLSLTHTHVYTQISQLRMKYLSKLNICWVTEHITTNFEQLKLFRICSLTWIKLENNLKIGITKKLPNILKLSIRLLNNL